MTRSVRMARWVGIAAAVIWITAAAGHDEATIARADTRGCVECHAFDAGLSHPVDVYPSMATPSHLPLTDGRMTCGTCHDLRAEPDDALLRRAPDDVRSDRLCMQCHEATRGGYADLHALATEHAHLGVATGRRGFSRESREWTAGLDTESGKCLTCHDGALASGGSVRSGPSRGPATAARFLGGQHPIGVEQRPRGAADTLLSPAAIDPVVRLFNGRVGCGSCHSPYAGGDDLLVLSNERSGLCLACHDF